MKLTFLFRNEKTGFSIEELFNNLVEQVRQSSDYEVNTLTMPYLSSSVNNMLRNVRFVRKYPADVYHITGDNHYLALVLPSKKTVLTIHDCITLAREKAGRNPLRFAVFWLLWYYLPIWKAKIVTTISDKSKEELSHYIGRRLARKLVVIPNFCDPKLKFSPKPFCDHCPTLLQIGTGINKNLARIMEAISGIPCKLDIVGPLDEETKQKLKEYAITYVHSQHLSRSEIIRKYEECDLVLFASTYEGFGMPILEANAIGRPVITSNLSPMREVAASGALLVDPFDISSVRDGILRLISDSLYREKIVRNGLLNSKRFSGNQVTASYMTVYEQLYNE